jgi:hypothetical protein
VSDHDPPPSVADDADAALAAELADLLQRRNRAPHHVVDMAKGLFSWRNVDAELADLVHDSVLDEPAPVRASGQPRILSFEAGHLTVDVELDASPLARRMQGQLVPAMAARLELRGVGASVTGLADELGRFVLPLPIASERMSLRCTLPDGTVVETAWVVL